MFDAGNFRPVVRPGTGRNQNGLGAHALAVSQPYGVGVFQHGAAFHQRDVEALERRGIGGFQPRHLAMDVADQRRPVERGLRHGPAEPGGIIEFIGEA